MIDFDYGDITSIPALVSNATTGAVLSLNEAGLKYFGMNRKQLEENDVPTRLLEFANSVISHINGNEEAVFLLAGKDMFVARSRRLPGHPEHVLTVMDENTEGYMRVPSVFYSGSDELAALKCVETEGEYCAYMNLTKNTVDAPRSVFLRDGRLGDGSASGYFAALINAMSDAAQKAKLAKAFERGKLMRDFASGKTHQHYALELKVNGQFYWRKLIMNMLKSPSTGDIVALFTWSDVNDSQFRQRIFDTVLEESYDFIGCIFPDSDCFMMILDPENSERYPNKINTSYERTISAHCARYATEDNREYLKYCFSLKNLRAQLNTGSAYSFVGYGAYPDGTPTIKQHYFTYLTKTDESRVILYMRRDVTGQSDMLQVKINQTVHNIPFKEIVYLESNGRKCRIITSNKSYEVNDKISNIQTRLPGRRFMRCHRCYIVNCAAVNGIRKNCAHMCNGDVVFISRERINELRSKLK